MQEVDSESINNLNSNVTWYTHCKPTASVYVAISLGWGNVSGRFGSKNVAYFKHVMCVALPQNRVPLSLGFLESKEHFPDVLV